MKPIKVMVNGIPGRVACTVARHVLADGRFELMAHALTGPEIQDSRHSVGNAVIQLIQPHTRDQLIPEITQAHGPFLSVDYTHPQAVSANVDFYCRHRLPFVMGTTGGDRQQIEAAIGRSGVAAVVAPNMAKQIVGFQAMMEYAARTFPDLFAGYRLDIRESHQKGKADTSGTARAMVGYFNRLGIPFREDQITMERDPALQQSRWGIPAEHLAGHGWHTYSLVSADGTVRFEFTHNVNGREIYALGTLDALLYLQRKVAAGEGGRMFSMIDVLKGQ